MKIIVGLGNPGKEYKKTRHNVGFIIIDELLKKLKLKTKIKKYNSFYFQTKNCIFIKPQIGMNRSGECIILFLKYFKEKISNLLIIYDDISLPLQKYKYKEKGSSGGHNGIKNIIKEFNTENIKRLKIGINYNKKYLIKDWVLDEFREEEIKKIEEKFPEILEKIIKFIENGKWN